MTQNFINQLTSQFYYLIPILSFLIGWIFMPAVVRIAKTYKFVVKPNVRSSHTGAIPNIGGLNIFISSTPLLLFLWGGGDLKENYLLIGFIIIFIIGFVDDLIDLRSYYKLAGELLAGLFLIVYADVRISNFGGLFGIEELPKWFSFAFSYFVYVGIINAVNLIDGVDGLASGLGILYCLFFGFFFASVWGNTYIVTLSFVFAGSLAVFFIYNVFGEKNKIFMGDSGSLLLGYIVTLLVIEFCKVNIPEFVFPTKINNAPLVALSVVAIPVFDTLRVMFVRIKKRTSPFDPDKNHLHHLLLQIGFKHRNVSFIIIAFSALFSVLAFLLSDLPAIWFSVIMFSILTAFMGGIKLIANRKALQNKINE